MDSKRIKELAQDAYIVLVGFVMVFLFFIMPNMKFGKTERFQLDFPLHCEYMVTSPVGERGALKVGDTTISGSIHKGVDVIPLTENRSVPVYASADGIVVTHYPISKGGHKIYGCMVIIDHENGLLTMYAHLGSSCVREGMAVKKGQQIGVVGNTGQSTGPHLHWEVIPDPLKINALIK